MEEPERRVVFKAPGRAQSVPVEDADHILSHLVERALPRLRAEIKRAMQEDAVVVLDEEMRVELVLALDAIEERGELTRDEQALRDTFKEPIRTTDR